MCKWLIKLKLTWHFEIKLLNLSYKIKLHAKIYLENINHGLNGWLHVSTSQKSFKIIIYWWKVDKWHKKIKWNLLNPREDATMVEEHCGLCPNPYNLWIFYIPRQRGCH